MKKILKLAFLLLIGNLSYSQPNPEKIKQEITFQINEFRAKNGKGALQKRTLVQKTALDKAAQIHADWCVKAKQGGHVENLPVLGQPMLPTCADRGKYFGATVYGEIMFNSFPITESCTPKDRAELAVEGWANSKSGHREAMLMSFPMEVEGQVGVGISKISNTENWVIVTVFGANIDPISGVIKY